MFTHVCGCQVPNNPIYTTAARDPTELHRTSTGAYRLVDGTATGTEMWECVNCTTFEDVTGQNWERVGMFQENTEHTPRYWECPDVFPLLGDNANDAVWVSKYSNTGDHWFTGHYNETSGKFSPFDWEDRMYDTNKQFYASKTFLDSRSEPRRVLWGWLVTPKLDIGAQGAQSVPRVVEADGEDGNLLVTKPIPEIETLRMEETHVTTVEGLDTLNGRMMDFVGRPNFDQDATGCAVRVLSNGGDEYTDIIIPAGTVDVRILVDSSIVELYLDGGRVATTLFVTIEDWASNGVSLEGGEGCGWEQVEAWEMKPFEYDASAVM